LGKEDSAHEKGSFCGNFIDGSRPLLRSYFARLIKTAHTSAVVHLAEVSAVGTADIFFLALIIAPCVLTDV
jgi:hypothetical protein